jgi:hypothetical protein
MKFGWSRLEHDIIKQPRFFACYLNALKRKLFFIHKINTSKEVGVNKPLWRFCIGNLRKPLSIAFSMNVRVLSNRFLLETNRT